MQNFWQILQIHRYLPWFITPIVLIGMSTPVTAETLYIGKLASYAAPQKVREKVRTECMPEVQLPLIMREEIIKRTSIQEVVPTDELSALKSKLTMEFSILSLNIPPSAGWTSEKRTMKVKSVVYRNGVMAGEYIRYADSQGGGNLLNRSACEIVERLERNISVQTAEWLKTMNLFQAVPSPAPEPQEVKQK